MSTGRYEWKKILWHFKGIGLIILFMILRIIFLFFFDEPVNQDIVNDMDGYQYYLSMAEGKADEQKKLFFEEISEKFSEAESRMQVIYSDYSSGNLEQSQYESELANLEKLLEYKKGFLALYNQYMYARENPENRYLLDTNAWDGILSNDSLNILVVIAIMILALIIFGEEIGCEMDTIIRITRKGERRVAGEKIIITGVISIGIGLLNFLIELLFYQCKYGFSHGNYPLQSLSYFSEYTGDSTLNHAMVWILVYKMIGCLFWGIMVSAIIVLVKKYALAMVMALSALLLPYYGISAEYLKYYFPYPLGLMIGSGYFRGNISSYDSYKEKEETVFIQVSDNVRHMVLLISVLTILLLVFFIMRKYANCWNRIRIKRHHGMKVVMCLVLVILAVGAGCGRKEPVLSDDFYNWDGRYNYENKEYLIYVDYSDIEAPDILYENKNTGSMGSLVRDAFAESKRIDPLFYAVDDFVYYLELSYDNAERGMSLLYDKFSVIRVDLRDFSYTTVYKDNANISPSRILGMKQTSDTEADLYQEIVSFFVNGKYIYLVSGDEVWSIRITDGKRKMLFSYNGGGVSFDGKNIYYLDEMSRLIKYDVNSGETDTSLSIVTSKFVIAKDRIIYTDRLNGDALSMLQLANMESTVIEGNDNIFTFTTDGTSVFYVDSSDNKIYEINLEDNQKQEIGKASSAVIYPFRDNGNIYVPNFEEGTIERFSKINISE